MMSRVPLSLLRFSLLLFIIFPLSSCLRDVIATPEFACPGDSVTVQCVLRVPDPGDTFVSPEARFIVGSSNVSLADTNVNTGTGDPLSRLTAATNLGSSNSTFVFGSLTLSSFSSSDNGLRLGCVGRLLPNGGTAQDLIETVSLIAAAPPSPPTALSVSLTSLSPATCSGSVSVAWTPGASDRSIDMYFLFLNGDLLTPLSSSVNSHSYSINITTDTVYTYSVTANSCAGNSTPSNGVSISVESYSFVNSPPLFLTYNQSTSLLTVEWGLVAGNLSLLLAYSLQLNYSHSQYGTTYELTNSSSFSLLSNITLLTLLQIITPHNFSTTDGVVTNITACISITSQCGMPFYGDVLCGDFNSENPPTSTQPTTVTVLTSTSPIVTNSTNAPTLSQPTDSLPIPIIAAAVAGGVFVLFILIFILVIIILCICFGKKSSSKYPTHRRSDDNVELSAPSQSTDNILPSEAMYSQVSKPQKPTSDLYSSVHKQAPPQKELLYADLDMVTEGRRYPPAAPQTQYTDLAQFPQADQTLYASVHTDGPN